MLEVMNQVALRIRAKPRNVLRIIETRFQVSCIMCPGTGRVS
jgi:hypothetical protein